MKDKIYQLDWKDKKILQELDLNARQSFSKIAKNTRISKQTLIYRVNNLIDKKIIKKFITFIDIQKLGYTFYDIFFKVKYCSKNEEKAIIDQIKKMSEVGWFVSSRGEWKVIVCVMAKSPKEFNKILERVLEVLSEKVLSYEFFIVINASQLPYQKIYENYPEKIIKQTYLGKKQDIELNNLDLKILNRLAKDARATKKEIADKTDSTIEQVRYSLKKLEKSGIIQAYKPLIDIKNIGYLWHIMLIQFHYCQEKRKQEFITFLKNQPQVFYIVNGVGNWGLMVEFHTKDFDELSNIQNLIRSKFEEIIRDERTMQVLKEHKCVFFPEQLIV